MAIDNHLDRRWINADALLLLAVRDREAQEGLMTLLSSGLLSAEQACAIGSQGNASIADVELVIETKGARRIAPFGSSVQGTSAPIVSQATAGLNEQAVLFGTTGVVETSVVETPAERETYKSIVLDPRNTGGTGGIPPRGRPDIQG